MFARAAAALAGRAREPVHLPGVAGSCIGSASLTEQAVPRGPVSKRQRWTCLPAPSKFVAAKSLPYPAASSVVEELVRFVVKTQLGREKMVVVCDSGDRREAVTYKADILELLFST